LGFQFCRRMVNKICATEQKILVLVKYLLYLPLNPSKLSNKTTAANIFILTAKQTNLNVSISFSSLTLSLDMAKKLLCCVIYPILMAFCFEHFLLSTNLFACLRLARLWIHFLYSPNILYNIEVFLLLKIYLYRTRCYQ